MPGLPALQQAVAEHQRRFYRLEHDPAAEITIHAGATEALCAALAALLDPGDEAIVFEPFYDAYLPGIALAQATPRVVPLAPPDFRLGRAAVEAAVGPRTRLLVLNSPMNPAGRVFSREELAAIAATCVKHDLLAVTDPSARPCVGRGAAVSTSTPSRSQPSTSSSCRALPSSAVISIVASQPVFPR
jgi:N-succinyldiaminopimelate aminotransferase